MGSRRNKLRRLASARTGTSCPQDEEITGKATNRMSGNTTNDRILEIAVSITDKATFIRAR